MEDICETRHEKCTSLGQVVTMAMSARTTPKNVETKVLCENQAYARPQSGVGEMTKCVLNMGQTYD